MPETSSIATPWNAAYIENFTICQYARTRIKLKLSSKIDICYSYRTTLGPVNLHWPSDLQKVIHNVRKWDFEGNLVRSAYRIEKLSHCSDWLKRKTKAIWYTCTGKHENSKQQFDTLEQRYHLVKKLHRKRIIGKLVPGMANNARWKKNFEEHPLKHTILKADAEGRIPHIYNVWIQEDINSTIIPRLCLQPFDLERRTS